MKQQPKQEQEPPVVCVYKHVQNPHMAWQVDDVLDLKHVIPGVDVTDADFQFLDLAGTNVTVADRRTSGTAARHTWTMFSINSETHVHRESRAFLLW